MLDTDASVFGIGAVLSQVDDDDQESILHILAEPSVKLNIALVRPAKNF